MFRENECKKLFSRVDWEKLEGTLLGMNETLLSRWWRSFSKYIGADWDSYYRRAGGVAAGVDRRCQWIGMWEKCEWNVIGYGFEGWRCWSGSDHGFNSDDLTEIELTKFTTTFLLLLLPSWWTLIWTIRNFRTVLLLLSKLDLTKAWPLRSKLPECQWGWNGDEMELEWSWTALSWSMYT